MVATRHGRVAVVDHGGEGPDLVLLHGAGRTLADWGLVLRHLDGRRVVGVDFRWHGMSEDTGDVCLDANADDVEAVVDELGLDNAYVAGHSLGGMVAAVYASRHAACPGVANLDGHGTGRPDQYVGVSPDEVAAFREKAAEMSRAMAQLPSSGDDAWHESQVQQLRAAAAAIPNTADLVEAWIARQFRRDENGTWHARPSALYVELLRPEMDGLDLFALYRRVECPLVIYNCTKTSPSPVPGADRIMAAYRRGLARDLAALADERPNVTVETVDASHMLVFETPVEIAARLVEWSAR